MRNGKLTRLAKIVFLLLAFSVSTFAVGLPVYRDKIKTVRDNLEFLLEHDESETEVEIRREEREALDEIRKTLQPFETIEIESARLEADNGWLFTRLKTFGDEPDLSKRQTILSEIIERLKAIEYKLDELERQERSNRAKDEDKQKLQEILRRVEYQKPEKKEENFLQSAWRDFVRWLGKIFPASRPTSDDENAARPFSFLLQLVIYGLGLGIIGFLLYRFAPFLRQRFLNRQKTGKKERVILGEKLAEDETSQNLFSEAEQLAREGNLRAAFRKGYIALLCELSDRKIIGLAHYKTNRDYVRDTRKRPELHQNMNVLTNNFESVWYGFGKAEIQDWEKFKEKYQQTVSSER